MSRLQSVPGLGSERTSTPEGLANYVNEITRSPRPIASRIVKLGPVELNFMFIIADLEWDLDGDPFGEEAMPHVPPYWELVYNGAKEVADAHPWDMDFPEKLDGAIQNSTRGELYRAGLQEAITDATRDLRSVWRYRHYALRSRLGVGERLAGEELLRAWRVLRVRASEFIVAIRLLRRLRLAAGKLAAAK